MSLMAGLGFGLFSPLLKRMDAETAHTLTLKLLTLLPQGAPISSPALAQNLMGLRFPNPLGLAAGFDKNASIPHKIFALGFGFAEIGTITPLPQTGNSRPRILRLQDEKAVINRMGFPNAGMERARQNLIARQKDGHIVGVNIGPNAQSADRIADYAKMAEHLAPCASYIALNVSSPNTPQLRDLQKTEHLEKIINKLHDVSQDIEKGRVPLLLKISPDLEKSQIQEIAHLSLEKNLSGLIAANSSAALAKAQPRAQKSENAGGLSGVPLAKRANRVIAQLYEDTKGAIPIIGVGGCASAQDAYEKILSGASLLQLYTSLAYEGPKIIPAILKGLEAFLERDGYRHIGEAVGGHFRS